MFKYQPKATLATSAFGELENRCGTGRPRYNMYTTCNKIVLIKSSQSTWKPGAGDRYASHQLQKFKIGYESGRLDENNEPQNSKTLREHLKKAPIKQKLEFAKPKTLDPYAILLRDQY
jgi:hypothetical protein